MNRLRRRFAAVFILLIFSVPLLADTDYYHHVFFDNSLTPDFYYYSEGKVSSPSRLALLDGKIPVDTQTFPSPPNALRLQWNLRPGGGWAAQVKVVTFRNRDSHFQGNTLSFWYFSPLNLSPSDLPLLRVQDTGENFSAPLHLEQSAAGLQAGHWRQVRIPLKTFVSASIGPLDPGRLLSIIFSQDASDGIDHTLLIDQITIEPSLSATDQNAPPVPQEVHAKGFERHIDVSWTSIDSPELQHYVIYRSLDGNEYLPIGIQERGLHRYTDFIGKTGQDARYRVATYSWAGKQSALSAPGDAVTKAMTDDELLNMLQEECFRYYWESAGTHSGMARENIPGDGR